MAEGFGKIDFNLACRLGELTQNETRVLVYLYVCRNEETGKCNPSRKTISADTKLEKGNLSKAIAGLEKKGFVIEFESGNFELISAANIVNVHAKDFEEVVDSTTKVVNSTTRKVVSSTTKVVDLTTESCRTNNSHIKDLEQRKNRERTEKNIYSAHETFSDESQTTNEDHAAKIDETFIWLRQKKNLSRLPQSEWLALFTDLEAESITLDGFKEFYVWAESESWIVEKKVTLSPNVLRRMVEKYKNREHLEAKRKIQESKNGNISNGHNSKTSTAKQIESGERLNALIEDAKRFQPPTIR